MPLERAHVEAALSAKGFVPEDRDHRYFFYYTTQGKRSHVNTKVSFGTKYKNLGDDLVSLMARQCKLTNKAFKELVSCTLSRGDYEASLVSQQILTLDEPPTQEKN
jgi:hypothetical protein